MFKRSVREREVKLTYHVRTVVDRNVRVVSETRTCCIGEIGRCKPKVLTCICHKWSTQKVEIEKLMSIYDTI